ncbi:DUF4194 domain-containing protein [Haloplasma contractile]|uniref:DUF4194 domain-containing protein n=1 Tax=Haloplasma contractile SSD-17B TaxID=1033810 RepID=F7PW37_9MOLU|nr:DUF4194 domain-containing protein [Haloplasma contractile]ERJ12866.1 hypothetical protein HLPCO_001206 [Haloplasma contractile SSD-17B]
MNLSSISDLFNEKYKKLSSSNRRNFIRIGNKLLSVCFITAKKDADFEDYYFVEENYKLFQHYFQLIGWKVELDQNLLVVTLFNQYEYNRLKLKLKESIILLILRLFYEEKATLGDVVITINELNKKFLSLNLQDRPITKTDLRSILSLFRRYNLVEYMDRDLTKGNSRLIIYPTILYAVKAYNIHEVYKKVEVYK